jgi:hypothetical protein
MKTLISIVACIFSITAFAQTKLISFRSHSGNNANFRLAVEKDLFDIGNSNFGIITTAKIDSVIMASGKTIIVIRGVYTRGDNRNRHQATRDTLTRANASNVFAASNMQSLKAALQKKYPWTSLQGVPFIGFANRFKGNKQ